MRSHNFMEHPDDSMRSPDVQLCLIPVEVALKLKCNSCEAAYDEK